MRQIHSPFAILVLVAAIGQAYAQTAPAAEDDKKATVLAPTIVTGNRTAKAVDKIAGAITIVSKEEVAHTLALTEDATAVLARTVPGYSESSQAMSNTGENLRGRVALRLFDGVPQGSPLREGTRNGTFTDMGLVGKIEVINGPSASEGIGASGGIINYLSVVPTKAGDEFTLVSRYTTQFADDSSGFKLGGNFARKADHYDLLVGFSSIERGISYDANGRRIGMNTSGSVTDSKANNLFVKGGINFGQNDEQRLQLSVSAFKIAGKGNYVQVEGSRATGTTNTSERGQIPGQLAESNTFKQAALTYRHDGLFGGSFVADVYTADQKMRYLPELDSAKQDPLFAPPNPNTAGLYFDPSSGEFYEQSEIDSQKKGLRTSWTRPDMFVTGLELRAGIDLVKDVAQQRLALTNRIWAPPMEYTSTAPYAQLSYDAGPLTLSGGYRREDGQLKVDSYTTVYGRNRAAVQGGTLSYAADLTNLGAVLRLPQGWSVFGSVGKGFSLPNVGIPLRNVNYPGQSVAGILDLQAVLVDNNELGFNWRGEMGSLGGSYYESKSALGSSLSIDPVTNDFILQRRPVEITGYELNGELRYSKQLKVTALYSTTRGKTRTSNDGPLVREMGVLDINPDKFGTSVNWKINSQANLTLGATKLFSRDLNVGASGEEHTSGYTLYDLGGNYDLGRYGKLTLGVENLTNQQYILSWSQVVGFRNYWAGRGRVVSISHEIKF
jgi:iron complex outermembrane receptor protein